jgi:hypothetical protein
MAMGRQTGCLQRAGSSAHVATGGPGDAQWGRAEPVPQLAGRRWRHIPFGAGMQHYYTGIFQGFDKNFPGVALELFGTLRRSIVFLFLRFSSLKLLRRHIVILA